MFFSFEPAVRCAQWSTIALPTKDPAFKSRCDGQVQFVAFFLKTTTLVFDQGLKKIQT